MALPPEENKGPPNWINVEFIDKSLKHEYEINSIHVEDAVAAGENYATVVYRVIVDTTTWPLSLILKCVPESEFRAKFLRDGKLMEREIKMFEKTLQMLRGSLASPKYPHFYNAVQDGGRDTLVVKDMRPLGYTTRPRKLGLDAAHLRLVIKEIAHLHGLSIALRIQQPDVFKTEIQDFYVENMYAEENREQSSMFLGMTLGNLAQAIENNLPFRFYRISKIMKHISEHVFDELKNVIILPNDEEELEKRVLVLNHGDCWSNNMLFKYEEGNDEPLECCMIDFQLSRCGAPVQDLMYLFYSSTTQETRRKHMNELLQFYLDETLRVIKAKGIENAGSKFYKNIGELRNDMKKNEIFGFVIPCFVLPGVIAESDAIPDLDELMSDQTFTSKDAEMMSLMYKGPLFCKRMGQLIEDFDDMGLFQDYEKRNPDVRNLF
jgi:thiamine kinase-like enzyme